jgi:GNAT superfamily N-acetyltransferase
MAVCPEAQGSGVGYRLIDAVEKHAIENGFERLFLYTSDFLIGALQFYERCGFIRGRQTDPEEWHGTTGWEVSKKIGKETKQNAIGS